MTAPGRHHVALFEPETGRRTLVSLPGRAHAIMPLTDGRLLAMARRPGRFAVLIDPVAGRVERRFEAAPDRHFFGHAALSRDGRLLYTSENDFDAGRGVIGVRAAEADWRQVGEFDSHGIGPHEIALSADGTSLIVANGGIRTHPDEGRRKLNLDSMAATMACLRLQDGSLVARAGLPAALSRLSLRHIDIRADGLVAVAGQFQGRIAPATPLVWLWRPGTALAPLPVEPGLATALHGYCASVKFDAGGRFLAVTAPRGGLVGFWRVEPARYLGRLRLRDGAGIVSDRPGRFLAASGLGALVSVELRDGEPPAIVDRRRLPWHWDNHLTAL